MNILFQYATNVMVSKDDFLISATKPTGQGTGLSLITILLKRMAGS